MPVTADTLRQGAWYALEQAGDLFDAAVSSFDSEHVSAAMGLAILGREELGRYKILRRLADEVAKGRVVAAEDVRTESEAWTEANKIIEEATDTEAMMKSAPFDHHRLRTTSFHVDIHPDGASWRRPRKIAAQKARDEITSAVGDYAVQRDRLLNVPGDPEMTQTLADMNSPADPVRPRWPRA